MATRLGAGYIELSVKYAGAIQQVEDEFKQLEQSAERTGQNIGRGLESGITRGTRGRIRDAITREIDVGAQLHPEAQRVGMAIGDAISSGIERTGRGISNVIERTVHGAFRVLQGAALGGVLAAGAAVGTVFWKGFERLVEIDRATVALRGMGMAAGDVKRTIDDVTEVIKGTPIALDEALGTVQTFLSMGVKAGDDLKNHILAVADAAGYTQQPFSELANVFTDVMNKGRLTGEELMQFQRRNVPIVPWLAKVLGTDEANVSKMITDGKISSAAVFAAVEANAAGFGQRAASTIQGAMTQMSTAIARLGANLLAPIFGVGGTGEQSRIVNVINAITAKIDDLGKWVDQHQPQIIRGIASIGETFIKTAGDVTVFAGQFMSVLASMTRGVANIVGIWDSSKANQLRAGADMIDALGQKLANTQPWFDQRAQDFKNYFDNIASYTELTKALGDTVATINDRGGLNIQAPTEETKKKLQDLGYTIQEIPGTKDITIIPNTDEAKRQINAFAAEHNLPPVYMDVYMRMHGPPEGTMMFPPGTSSFNYRWTGTGWERVGDTQTLPGNPPAAAPTPQQPSASSGSPSAYPGGGGGGGAPSPYPGGVTPQMPKGRSPGDLIGGSAMNQPGPAPPGARWVWRDNQWVLQFTMQQAGGGFGYLPDNARIESAKPGGLVQWAESSTGGEAFIPLAASKRDRSLDIWARTGQILGVLNRFDNGGFIGSGISTSGMDSVRRLLASLTGNAPGSNRASYLMGGFSPTSIDCSGLVSAVVNSYLGQSPFSSRMSTPAEGGWLKERGFVMGQGPAGTLRIGWWDEGGGANGHTALTLPDGTNVESTTSNGISGVRVGAKARGANDSQFTMHAFLPGPGGLPLRISGGGGGRFAGWANAPVLGAGGGDGGGDGGGGYAGGPDKWGPLLLPGNKSSGGGGGSGSGGGSRSEQPSESQYFSNANPGFMTSANTYMAQGFAPDDAQRLRNAQDRINDLQTQLDMAQQDLDNAKTSEQRANSQNRVRQLQRDLSQSQEDYNILQSDILNQMANGTGSRQQQGQQGYGGILDQKLGDVIKGMLPNFGQLGDIGIGGLKESLLPPGFSDPTQWGLVQAGSGLLNWLGGVVGAFSPEGGAALSIAGSALGGSGSGIASAITGLIPQPWGTRAYTPASAAPDMPVGGAHLPQGATPGVPILPGPGNGAQVVNDNRIQIAPGGSVNAPIDQLKPQFDQPQAQQFRKQIGGGKMP